MRQAADVIRQARLLGGLSQVELSRRTGIAQPTISAYERGIREPSFRALQTLVAGAGLTLDIGLTREGERRRLPTTVAGTLLRERRSELLVTVRRHGASNLRVFGSVARGDDHPESDVDLLVDLPKGTSLIDLGILEDSLTAVLGRDVDLIPSTSLKPRLRDAVLEEAISLESP